MPALNPTQRFSSRVENYIRYRPHYPSAIVDLFHHECGLTRTSVIADIGSGTGILSEMLLENGYPVFGVEPNREMREAAERLLKRYPGFRSISGTAEATTLASQSVDLITVAQAFHWFDREQARAEFGRIRRSDGRVALLWNDRDITSHPFLQAYEQLVRTFGTDYQAVNHRQIDAEAIGAFFGANRFEQSVFPNRQVFDWNALKGRLMSSSYAPEPGHPGHEPMLKELQALFQQYQTGGTVAFEYRTIVYCGSLSA
jgi:SAM-dependent methyltransferase